MKIFAIVNLSYEDFFNMRSEIELVNLIQKHFISFFFLYFSLKKFGILCLNAYPEKQSAKVKDFLNFSVSHPTLDMCAFFIGGATSNLLSNPNNRLKKFVMVNYTGSEFFARRLL